MGDSVGVSQRDWILRKVFELSGAFKRGHFVLTSGRHSNVYFNKRVISEGPEGDELLPLTGELLICFFQGIKVDMIVSPEEGAIPFGRTTARLHFERIGTKVEYLTAYKRDDAFFIDEDDQMLISGKRVAIVEDIFTTGASTAKTVQAVLEAGGEPVIIVGLLNRSNGRVQELLPEFPIRALVTVNAEDWDEEDCKLSGLCAQGIEICTEPKIGHGAEYVAKNGQPKAKAG